MLVEPEWLAESAEVDDTLLEATAVERDDNDRPCCRVAACDELAGLVLRVPEPARTR